MCGLNTRGAWLERRSHSATSRKHSACIEVRGSSSIGIPRTVLGCVIKSNTSQQHTFKWALELSTVPAFEIEAHTGNVQQFEHSATYTYNGLGQHLLLQNATHHGAMAGANVHPWVATPEGQSLWNIQFVISKKKLDCGQKFIVYQTDCFRQMFQENNVLMRDKSVGLFGLLPWSLLLLRHQGVIWLRIEDCCSALLLRAAAHEHSTTDAFNLRMNLVFTLLTAAAADDDAPASSVVRSSRMCFEFLCCWLIHAAVSEKVPAS